ncbi:hypothetical protein Hanom_Chr01g00077001 [Helianthus anomalus]
MASQPKNTSSSMPAFTSSQSIPPLPPAPSGSQKNAENATKKPTPVFSKGSTVSSSTPSNNDLSTLILQMKGYMEQQDRTNQRILREIDEIKKQKRSAEDHSPLMPKSLNFDTPATTAQQPKASDVQYQGSSGIYQGSLAMTQPQASHTQHQGSYLSSRGYFETVPPKGSYFQHQGSSSQVRGSSSQVQGSMEYPLRPSAPMYPGPNILQDQGSSGSQPTRNSEVHIGDFIPMQAIASSGPTVTHEVST